MDEKRYLVQAEQSDGTLAVSLDTASSVISRVDMSDYTDEVLHVFDISKAGEVSSLTIHGTWHKDGDPLYIKVTDKNGNTVFDGYGTDH